VIYSKATNIPFFYFIFFIKTNDIAKKKAKPFRGLAFF
jgi:hypothetical protein